MSDDLREARVKGQEILKGGFLHAFRDEVRLPDGTLTQREYIVHPGAVMIVPLRPSASPMVVSAKARMDRPMFSATSGSVRSSR